MRKFDHDGKSLFYYVFILNLRITVLDNYYDKHHNHWLQAQTVKLLYPINNHMVSGEAIVDFTKLTDAI